VFSLGESTLINKWTRFVNLFPNKNISSLKHKEITIMMKKLLKIMIKKISLLE